MPPQPNSWRAQTDGSLLLRLGITEFLLEAPITEATGSGSTGTVAATAPEKVLEIRPDLYTDWLKTLFPDIAPASWQMPQIAVSASPHALGQVLGSPEQCCIVPRNDAVFTLSGDTVLQVLAEFCALDLARMPQDTVAMTDVAGVAASLIRMPQANSFRLWCDGSYRADMRALLVICNE
jgi:hypothetical protein